MILRTLVIALAALAAAQTQPTFRSRVDLIRLDASVLDADGRPVRDLRAEDFIVRVDGKPRAVSFARFYGPDEERATVAQPREPASFASNTGAARGRVVVIVVDVESMEPGYEKLVLDTAGRLVDSLGPTDSVALLIIPGKGIDLTRDHRRVREALERLRGFASRSVLFQHTISVREAEAIGRRDGRTLAEVIERECMPTETTCPAEIILEARQLLIEADRRIHNVMHTLLDLNQRLLAIDLPRTVVFISAGLSLRQESGGLFRDLQRRAAEAGTMTYVIQLEQPETDASGATRRGGGLSTRTDLAEGLQTIAGVTGGTFRAGVGSARGVFDRIRTEIVHTYQLGVESVPSDADGKVHKVDVQVRRAGASVKTHHELVVSNAPRSKRTPVDVLNLPPGLAEVPMTATAYATLGDRPEALKVIILVDALGGASISTPLSYALTIANDERTTFETNDAMAPTPSGARAVIAAQVAPGRYWLRAAIVDADGKAGSVELPLALELHQAGPLQCSDLIIGTSESGFAPATHIATGKPLSALLELYATDPAQFNGVSVDLELRAAGSESILTRAPATLNLTPAVTRRIADGQLDVPGLAPGTYAVSAVVTQDGQPVATIGRTIVLR
jgi:VWFA-related protein